MKNKRTLQLLYWAFSTSLLPTVLVSVVWAWGQIDSGSETLFGEVFGTGDLLPLAALLFFGVWADIRLESSGKRFGSVMAVQEVWFILLATVLILFYGLVKSS